MSIINTTEKPDIDINGNDINYQPQGVPIKPILETCIKVKFRMTLLALIDMLMASYPQQEIRISRKSKYILRVYIDGTVGGDCLYDIKNAMAFNPSLEWHDDIKYLKDILEQKWLNKEIEDLESTYDKSEFNKEEFEGSEVQRGFRFEED